MRPACGVVGSGRPLTHVGVRSRPILASALHSGHLTPTPSSSP